ncbi:MAG: hypothetical protein AB7D06_17120 [Pedobacter sp.]
MAKIEVKYRCSECGEIHDTGREAVECCTPEVFEVYICPTCGEGHDDEDEARECCASEAAGADGSIDYHALELAGQQRLF